MSLTSFPLIPVSAASEYLTATNGVTVRCTLTRNKTEYVDGEAFTLTATVDNGFKEMYFIASGNSNKQYFTMVNNNDKVFRFVNNSGFSAGNASENYQRTITIYGIGYSGRIYQFNSIKIKVSPNIPIQPPQSNSLTSNQSKVVAEAKKYIGYSTLPGGTNGYYKCQAWVYQIVYRALGIKAVDVSRGTAKEAYQAWCVSSSKSNIPAGATVYFNITSSYHVGIYVGDGMVVHMWSENGQRIVKMQSLDSISNYLGWGWQAGYQLN